MKITVRSKVVKLLRIKALVISLMLVPAWVLSQSSPSPVICHGGQISLQCSGGTVSGCGIATTYQWTGPYGFTSSTASPVINLGDLSYPPNPASALSLTYTLTISGGVATQTGSTVITVNPSPAPEITGNSALCPGSDGVTYYMPTGLDPYYWTLATGGTITTSYALSYATVDWGTTPGIYTLSVTYSPVSGGGCTASRSVKAVQIYSPPTPSNIGLSNACSGTTVTYTTESGKTNYVWTVLSGYSSISGVNTNQLSVTWNSAGTYTVSVSYNDEHNCPTLVPTVKTVTVNGTPSPTITGANTVCRGQDITYYTESGQSLYQWNVGPDAQITSGSNTNSITVKWSSTGSAPTSSVTVNYTNPLGGCAAARPAIKTITVNSPVIPTISGPSSMCDGVTGSVYYTESGMNSYAWTVDGSSAGSSTSTSVTVNWPAAGAHTVTVNYTLPSTGCRATTATSYAVTVRPIPSVTATPATATICSGTSTGITLSATTPSTFSWTIGTNTGGITGATAGSGSAISQLLTNPSNTTTGSVEYLVVPTSVAGSCIGSVYTITVLVSPSPEAPSVTLTQPGCATPAGTITVTAPTGTGMTYSINGTTYTTSTTFTSVTAGNYTVTARNSTGCVSAGTTVTITPQPPTPATPTVTLTQPTCLVATGIITITAPTGTGMTYSIDGSTYTSTMSFGLLSTGTYTVTARSLAGCTSAGTTATITTQPDTPVAPTVSLTQPGCTTPTGAITVTAPTGAGLTYSINGSTYTSSTTFAAVSPGTYTVTVKNTSGCISSGTSATIDSQPATPAAPSVTLVQPSCTTPTGSVTITAPTGAGMTYSISGSTYTTTATFSSLSPGSYTVTAKSLVGCISSSTPFTINTQPATPATPSVTISHPTCTVATGSITVTSPVGSGMTYSIDGATYTNTSGIFTLLPAGTYPVTAKNSLGCISAATTAIINPQPATPSVTSPDAYAICSRGTTNIVLTATTASTYVWTLGSITGGITGAAAGSGTTITQTLTNPSNSVAGAVRYLVVPTSTTGSCVGSVYTITVTVNPVPATPVITGTTSLCAGSTGVTYFTETGLDPYDWTITPDDATYTDFGTNSILVDWPDAGLHTITVTYNKSNGFGCSVTSSTLTVTVRPSPVPANNGLALVCNGSTVTYTTETGKTDYIWTVSEGYSAISGVNTSQLTVTWNTEGTHYVGISYNDGCATAVPTVKTVTVTSSNIPTITGASLVCSGQNIEYYTESGMASYVWRAGPGGTITSGAGTRSITVKYSIAGTSSVTVNYTNPSCGYSAPQATVKTVTVNSAVVPALTGPVSVCAGTTGHVYNTDAGMIEYIWTVSTGGTTNTTTNTVTSSITVTWNVAGARTVTVNYKYPSTGCTAATATQLPVTVNAIPSITATTPGSRCGQGTVTLGATASAGTVNWYATATGVTSVGTGDSFTTGILTTTTTYYVDATANGCTTATRTAIIATVNTIPTITATTPASICGPGSITLEATASSASSTVNWYTQSTGGSSVFSGTTFQTTVSATTTFYVDATLGSCTTATRTAVIATVKVVPAITATSPASRCGQGTVTLGATPSAGTVSWYDALTSGSLVATGTTFTTPVLSLTTTYYVDATLNGCTTGTRTAVTATINEIPAILTVTPASRCGAGAVMLMASATTGTVNWYTSSIGGTALATGNTYTTTSLVVTTPYYVDATLGSCTTSTRTVVLATVNEVPSITWTSGAARCGDGSVTLMASASTGTVNWYAAQTGGTTLTTGTSYTTPALTTTTTYWVDATLGSCTTATRTAVTATINVIPAIVTTTPATRCGQGTATLGAAASAGTVNWYADATGGSVIATGTSYLTPVLTTTTTYWVDATLGTCTTATRTAVVATVVPIPTITATAPGSICGPGSVTLGATSSSGVVNWYTASTGGIAVASGTTYTTPVITATTTYWVDATLGTCTTATRTAIVATINEIPAITWTNGATRCGAGAVTLEATSSIGAINWYTSSSGGTPIFTGGTFTPIISATTTYWVNATTSTCTSTTRTAVTATINAEPAITTANSQIICSGASTNIVLSATTASTYVWSLGTITGGITGAAAGSGTTITQTLTNPGNSVAGAVRYLVVPTSTTGSCIGSVYTITVTVNPVPATPVITGTTSLCAGSAGVTYFTEPGLDPYDWTITPNDATYTDFGTNSIEVDWTVAGLHTITVTYNKSNGFGCSVTSSMLAVTVRPSPVPANNGLAIVCNGSTVTYTTETGKSDYIWTVSEGYSAISGVNTSQLTVTWNTEGTHYVGISYNDGCATAVPTVKTVTVTSSNIPTITGAALVCAGQNIEYYTESGMASYVWRVGPGGTITSGAGTRSITVKFSIAGTSSVTVNYTNPSCGYSAPQATVKTVTVNSAVVPALTGPVSVCAGTTGHAYNTDAGMNSYTWIVSPGGLITGGSTTNSITVTWNTAGTRTVSVNYTYPSTGCTAATPTQLPVTVNAIPSITATTPGSRCGQGTVTLGATASAGTVNWYSTATGVTSLGTGESFTTGILTTTTTYYADATANGCTTATRTAITATVNTIPAILTVTPDSRCGEGAVTLGATASAGTVNWYIQSTGGTAVYSGTTYSTTVSATTTFYVDATLGSCTTATRTAVVATVNEPPSIIRTNGATRCGAGMVTLEATASSGTIKWYTSSSGGIPVFTGGTFTPTISVTTTYWVSATTATCTSTTMATVTATINAIPVITTTNSQSTCSGGTTSIVLTATTPSTYVWTLGSITGGITGAAAGSGSTITQILVNPSTTTSGSVQYLVVPVSTTGSCTGSVYTITVTVLPVSVTPTITGTTTLCQGSSGVVYYTEPNKNNYSWTITPGGIITTATNTSAITVSWPGTGIQTITVNYTNPSGCYATVSAAKTINVLPAPVPTITGPEASCNSVTTVYTTEPGMSVYAWNVSPGGTILSGLNTNAIQVRWNTTGDQTISVTYVNTQSCPTLIPSVKTVTVYQTPGPTIASADSTCLNGSVTYTTQPGYALYQWSVGAGGILTSGGGTPTITVKWVQPGARTVSVNYTNVIGGCSAAVPTVRTITVFDFPVPVINGPSSVCESTTGHVYTTTTGMLSYSWNISAGGVITSGSAGSITVRWNTSGPQTVSLGYIDNHGCPSVNPTLFDVTVHQRPVPVITGTSVACAGSSDNVYMTEAEMGNYVWTVSAGGSILTSPTTSTIAVAWSTPGLKTITVNYVNGNGCSAITPAVFTCTVNPQPVPALTGPAQVCLNAPGVTYSTTPSMTAYNWTVSPGGVITGGGGSSNNTITVLWTTPGLKSVTVNYTNSFGCQATTPTVRTTTVIDLPVPVISGAAQGCELSSGNTYSTAPSMFSYLWTINGGSITSGQGSQTITVSWGSAGTHTITVNYANQYGCTAAQATVRTIVVKPLPVPVITGAQYGCVSFTSDFLTEQGMTNYQWTVSPGGTIMAGTNSPTVTINWIATGIQTITVIYTDLNGCTASPTVRTVTVQPNVVPTITGPANSCTESPVVYVTEPGMTNYQWSVSTGGVITSGIGSQTVTVIWYTPGNHTVTTNYTNPFGCNAVTPSAKVVTVTTSPVPWVSGPATVCRESSGVVYATDPGMQNYLWTISAGGTITSGLGTSSITVNWSVAGLQTITVNYTDPAGCMAAQATSGSVTVLATPVPAISGPAAVCNGTTAVYFTEAGMNGYSWVISPGGVITSGVNSATVIVDWIASGAQSITVTYTDLYGCTALTPSLKTVTVHPLPAPTITNASVACIGGTTTFVTEAGMSQYQWTVSAGATILAGAGTNTIVVGWLTAGIKTVTVSYMDLNGCYPVQLVSKQVEVSPLPLPIIAGSGTACLGTPGNVYATDPGMTNYNWVVSSGGVITSGAGTSTITVTWTSMTPQVLSVNYTNPAGCQASSPTQFGVTINALPVPGLTGTSVTCAGSVNSVYVTEPGMTNYVWNVSAGGTILTTPTASASSITVAWTSAGSQWVTVNYTNANGCGATTPTTKTVVVQVSPTPSILGASSVCVGTTGVVYSTDPGYFNYVWTITPGGIITSGTGTSNITVTWLTSGQQTLTVNYTNASGCSAGVPAVKAVVVNALSVPTISGNSFSCVNGTTSHTTEAGMTGYQWTVSSGGTIISGSGTNSVLVQWTTSGQKFVTVSYTNPLGCGTASPTTKTVTVYSLPVPTVTGPISLCTGATNVVYSTEGGMVNYLWTVTAGGVITSGSNTNMITVNWNSSGIQGVTANYTDAHGCSAPVATNLPVTVNPVPVPTITGNANPCMTSGNYNYTTEQGMQNYLWTVSAGGIIVGGQGTRNVQIYWTTPGSQSVTVVYSTPVGCQAQPGSLAVLVRSIPGTPGMIAGDTLICKPLNGVIYSVAPIPEAIGYDWAVPAGATIISGSNTNIITVNFGANSQSGNISVFGINTCGNGPYSPILHISVHPYPETPHITVIDPDTLVSSAPAGNQWYLDNQPIPGATAQQYVAYLPGKYFVIANPFGCPSNPSNLIGIYPVGVDDNKATEISVYPNPADNLVTLAFSAGNRHELMSVWLIDNIGQERELLKGAEVQGDVRQTIGIEGIPSGIYHLVVRIGQEKFIKKLIIMNR